MKNAFYAIWARMRRFWDREALWVLGANLGLHLIVQLIALQFMPLPYFSRLSLHDGNTYFQIAQNLWPPEPIVQYSWQKRILLPVLAKVVLPGNMELSFMVIGIAAASLSAVYFYKIAAIYTQHPLRLTILYSALPWLFFAAHHGLNEPLMMLFTLAGFYYYTQERDFMCTASIALALLSKELTALPALAIGILYIKNRGWKRTFLYGLAILPVTAFAVAYGIRWGDMMWYLTESQGIELDSFLSWKTGLWWILQTLKTGTESSANPTVAFLYDIGNQILNLLKLFATGFGIILLSKKDKDLAFFNLLSVIPLWFLGRNQYMLSSSLGRQFLIVALTILAYDKWVGSQKRPLRFAYIIAIIAMLALGILWTLLYAKFFLHYKLF